MAARGGEQRIPRPPDARIGGPAPWSHVPADRRRLSLAQVRTRCAALPPAAAEVVAELDTLATVGSRFTIAPFVGLIDPLPPLVPHPGEVVRILEVPLSELLEDDAFHEEYWGSPDRAISFFELPDETVWGATARVLVSFLAHLTASL